MVLNRGAGCRAWATDSRDIQAGNGRPAWAALWLVRALDEAGAIAAIVHWGWRGLGEGDEP